MRYFERIVLICMDTKVFYFVEGNGLIFAWFGIRRDVILRIGSESANIDFSGGHGSMRINLRLTGQLRLVPRPQPMGLGIVDSAAEWIHRFQITSIHIQDANDFVRQLNDRIILPANDIFASLDFAGEIRVVDHIFICFRQCVHASFGSFDGQSE